MFIQINSDLIINTEKICSIEKHTFWNRMDKKFDVFVIGLENNIFFMFGDYLAINDTAQQIKQGKNLISNKDVKKYFTNGSKISIFSLDDYKKFIKKINIL